MANAALDAIAIDSPATDFFTDDNRNLAGNTHFKPSLIRVRLLIVSKIGHLQASQREHFASIQTTTLIERIKNLALPQAAILGQQGPYAPSRTLPLARRLRITRRPPGVLIRMRNPETRRRLRFVPPKVRLVTTKP